MNLNMKGTAWALLKALPFKEVEHFGWEALHKCKIIVLTVLITFSYVFQGWEVAE